MQWATGSPSPRAVGRGAGSHGWRCAGREPPLEAPGTLRRIGRFVGRLHAVGRRRDFVHRLHMDPARDAAQARDRVLAAGFVGAVELPAWRAAADAAVVAIADAFARHGPCATLRLHGDCHAGNVLWRPDEGAGAPHVVDLDDAVQGPAVQDLWMFLSGDRNEQTPQLAELLAGYTEFRDFDAAELNLIEALRTLRIMHYAAWLARRRDDPAFAIAFPWFNTQRYWDEHVLALREQIALMDEEPLAWECV